MNSDSAEEYCSSTAGAGWRLPTIQELKGIYDASQNVNGFADMYKQTFHIKGGIHLAIFLIRSGSEGKDSREVLSFAFDSGWMKSGPRGGISGVLCVRGSGQ